MLPEQASPVARLHAEGRIYNAVRDAIEAGVTREHIQQAVEDAKTDYMDSQETDRA